MFCHSCSVYVQYELYVWGKFANLNEFYNGYESTEQLGLYFLSRVSILLLTRDIDIIILSVRPSVRLSVTCWYCMKTA